jgi:uncharacterized protein (DUF2141 family)
MAAAQSEAIVLPKADHRRVDARSVRCKAAQGTGEKHGLVNQICSEFMVQVVLEEDEDRGGRSGWTRLKPVRPRAALLSRARSLVVAVTAVALLAIALPVRAAESEDGASATADLEVSIDGVRSDAGTIMIGLYDSVGGFTAAIEHCTEGGLLNDKGRLAGMALRAASGTRRVVFTQLPPGRYAVIVFHDENDNGRLDENGWGVPTEGYAFSNNAEGLLGAPSFDAAGFTLDGQRRSIALLLIYPKPPSVLDLSQLDK